MEDKDRLSKELADLRKEVNTQGVRLTLAQAWLNLYTKGYDALLYYGVNFKDLKEYKDEFPEEAMQMPVTKARNTFIAWMGRLESAIHAAVRRKGFKLV